MTRSLRLAAAAACLLSVSACTAEQRAAVIEAYASQRAESVAEPACPVVPTEYGDLFGYDLHRTATTGVWRWESPDAVTYGFVQQEDGLVYQTRWCALHMPVYDG